MPSLRTRLAGFLHPIMLPALTAADWRISAVSSAVDLRPIPTPELVRLMLAAGDRAVDIELSGIAARAGVDQAGWLTTWPGEHYQLLAGLVEHLQPTVVVEIGTWQGLGALSLLHHLPAGSTVTTFDITAWPEIPDQLLTAADFADGRLRQVLGDLSDPLTFERHRELLESADLIFMDAPKDGHFEPAFLELAIPALRGRNSLLVIDDIRLPQMLQLWRDLPLTKVDATSLGHWSGTGLALS